jgi:hypothetical protein
MRKSISNSDLWKQGCASLSSSFSEHSSDEGAGQDAGLDIAWFETSTHRQEPGWFGVVREQAAARDRYAFPVKQRKEFGSCRTLET